MKHLQYHLCIKYNNTSIINSLTTQTNKHPCPPDPGWPHCLPWGCSIPPSAVITPWLRVYCSVTSPLTVAAKSPQGWLVGSNLTLLQLICGFEPFSGEKKRWCDKNERGHTIKSLGWNSGWLRSTWLPQIYFSLQGTCFGFSALPSPPQLSRDLWVAAQRPFPVLIPHLEHWDSNLSKALQEQGTHKPKHKNPHWPQPLKFSQIYFIPPGKNPEFLLQLIKRLTPSTTQLSTNCLKCLLSMAQPSLYRMFWVSPFLFWSTQVFFQRQEWIAGAQQPAPSWSCVLVTSPAPAAAWSCFCCSWGNLFH